MPDQFLQRCETSESSEPVSINKKKIRESGVPSQLEHSNFVQHCDNLGNNNGAQNDQLLLKLGNHVHDPFLQNGSLSRATSVDCIGGTVTGRKSSKSNKQEKESFMAIASFSMEQPISANPETELAVMNTELPIFINKAQLGRSRTSSLDEEYHLSYDENPKNLDIKHPHESSTDPEPNSGWVKRLRLHSMDSFAVGTKSYKVDDPSADRRVHKLFTRVLNYSKTNSNITLHKYLEQHHSGKSILLSGNEDSPVEILKNSDSWIRRWCHDSRKAAQPRVSSEAYQRTEGRGLHEGNRTASRGDFEGKHFPSITAMAMMGKAVCNFRPCEFKRKGPSIVWMT